MLAPFLLIHRGKRDDEAKRQAFAIGINGMENCQRATARSTTMATCSQYSDKKETDFPGSTYAKQTFKLAAITGSQKSQFTFI